MDPIECLVQSVFAGDWVAYRCSLPERKTIKNGDGTWYTAPRT